MRVVLLEASGAHDFLTVEAVDGGEVEVSYRGRLSSTYAAGRRCWRTSAVQTFARRPDPATGIPQLTHTTVS